jgi:hypothetical protein
MLVVGGAFISVNLFSGRVLTPSCVARLRPGCPTRDCTLRMPMARSAWRSPCRLATRTGCRRTQWSRRCGPMSTSAPPLMDCRREGAGAGRAGPRELQRHNASKDGWLDGVTRFYLCTVMLGSGDLGLAHVLDEKRSRQFTASRCQRPASTPRPRCVARPRVLARPARGLLGPAGRTG